MGADGLHAATQVLQGGQLAQLEALSQDEAHASRELVFAHDKLIHPSQPSQLHIIRIGIVALSVFFGKERFAGILCRHEAPSQAVVAVHIIAQRVAVGIAQIAILVALPFVERDAEGAHEGVLALVKKTVETGEAVVGRHVGLAADINEERQ